MPTSFATNAHAQVKYSLEKSNFDLRASCCSFSSLPSDPDVSFDPLASVPEEVSRDIVVVVSETVSPPSTLDNSIHQLLFLQAGTNCDKLTNSLCGAKKVKAQTASNSTYGIFCRKKSRHTHAEDQILNQTPLVRTSHKLCFCKMTFYLFAGGLRDLFHLLDTCHRRHDD